MQEFECDFPVDCVVFGDEQQGTSMLPAQLGLDILDAVVGV